jgi:glycosyltransferase involved in cell wall biosynthesis
VSRILSTHLYDDRHPEWAAKVDSIDRRRHTRRGLFRRLITEAGRYDALILNGSIGMSERYVDLLAAAAIRRTRRRPPGVVLTDCSWRVGEMWVDRAACKAGLRLLDGDRVRFCVRSTAELDLFVRNWGAPREHVVFTPYAHTATDAELAAPSTRNGPVFAGGNSLRDYATLLEAARGLDVPVHLETNVISPEDDRPANVTVRRIGSHDEFVAGMQRAAAVVTPMLPGIERAAGLDTYLTAMALGKLVIVTEAPGVRDYVEHGTTGLVVPPGDVDALRSALVWATDEANAAEVEAIAARAAEVARTRYTYAAYVSEILRVAEGLAAAR